MFKNLPISANQVILDICLRELTDVIGCHHIIALHSMAKHTGMTEAVPPLGDVDSDTSVGSESEEIVQDESCGGKTEHICACVALSGMSLAQSFHQV